ncbi:hypothetical protein RF11_03200 [Thelohanellus kitauei]|uniref:Uncharacterized protein n=1 Tax=Thelohanellus kitauei TaxID=669202 RepID=A0A0C2MYC8_THEKT|nr:hypothetical protein RF11_03200 [Thelohanellus kitauei]
MHQLAQYLNFFISVNTTPLLFSEIYFIKIALLDTNSGITFTGAQSDLPTFGSCSRNVHLKVSSGDELQKARQIYALKNNEVTGHIHRHYLDVHRYFNHCLSSPYKFKFCPSYDKFIVEPDFIDANVMMESVLFRCSRALDSFSTADNVNAQPLHFKFLKDQSCKSVVVSVNYIEDCNLIDIDYEKFIKLSENHSNISLNVLSPTDLIDCLSDFIKSQRLIITDNSGTLTSVASFYHWQDMVLLMINASDALIRMMNDSNRKT